MIGPTGSGKTPLGKLLDEQGLWQERCFHFDFGESLRRIAAGDEPAGYLARKDIDFIRRVLEAGALLENHHFHIAEAILNSFIDERNINPDDFVILNGLPRHAGQAEDIDRLIDVQAVAHLSCRAEVALKRIRSNIGGDRSGRSDDDLESVRNKLALFTARTAPLLDHYRLKGARIENVEVAADTTAEDIRNELNRRG